MSCRVLLLTVLSSVLVMAASAGEDRLAVERGRDLYRIYCRTCHGEHGRGDGPTAEVLKVVPPDLTRLSARNGGAFPDEEVRAAIDGRGNLLAHGASEMPIWGLAFQELDTDVSQEAQVRERIAQLVRYLESIQTRP